MSLRDKYQPLIDMANQVGVSNMEVSEEEGFLKISGNAPSAAAKQQLWQEYGRIDPDFRSGDLVLNIDAPEGEESGRKYTVQSGDTLSKIGSQHNVSWQKIFEANRDKLDDPDKIYPGQELTIPQE